MKKIIAIVCLLLATTVYANQGYQIITPAQPTQTGNQIEVLEVFWYGCPHCHDFEPFITAWLKKKPDDVTFRTMPGIFNKVWITHAKAFYTAEKMGVLEQFHAPLFNAIHKQGKNIQTDEAVFKFVAAIGLDAKQFKSIFNSGDIDDKIKQAFLAGKGYKIASVPSVVVNGRYLVSGSTAGSYGDMLKVIDSLIKKERERIAKTGTPETQ